MRSIEVQADAKIQGRLDLAFVKADVGLSRRKIRAIIDVGGAYINGKRVRIASRQVARGDALKLQFSPTSLESLKHQTFTLAKSDIVYEDAGIIAINKPPGLPSQATRDQAVQHAIPCLEAYFRAHGKTPPKLILVHRLDKETSGVLLLAKTAKAAKWLTSGFRERKIKKTYEAIVHGAPEKAEFSIKGYLSPLDKRLGLVRIVYSGGKPSLTNVALVRSDPERRLSLLACQPETGRTHQIRVHLDSVGCPIVGDKRYGHDRQQPLTPELAELADKHQLLHAKAIEFEPGPGRPPVRIEAPHPPNWHAFLEQLGSGPAKP